MSDRIIGTCSICGGNVVLPEIWHGVNPPVARCESCGATKRRNLPVIPMEPNNIPDTPWHKPTKRRYWEPGIYKREVDDRDWFERPSVTFRCEL